MNGSEPTRDTERLMERSRALRDAAEELAGAARNALFEAERLARSGVETRPYAVLGIAFGIGWVLGGGVPLRLMSLATGAFGKVALGLAAARFGEGGNAVRGGNGGLPDSSQFHT